MKPKAKETWKVKSSNINEVGYNEDIKTMFITFKNKDQYAYNPVSRIEVEKLLRAKSIGSHFHKEIRMSKKYDWAKLT